MTAVAEQVSAVDVVEEGARKRAVLYLRVSTARQADKTETGDGFSLPAQEEACRRRAAELGADVVDVYVDRGESAKTAERPRFQQMLSRIRADRDIDYVILDKVDRFARNRRDDANILFDLQTNGAKLVSVKENIDETPAGQLLHAIMAGIAEFYSRNLATEALKGMNEKAKQGGTPGLAPIGYFNTRRRLDGGREIRVVEVDSERARLLQWAFQEYATGQYTITSLTEALKVKGLRSRPFGSKPPRPLQPSKVHFILTNRYYMGYVRFKGQEYPGTHEPLVSEDLFLRVQIILRLNAAGEKTRIHQHYLKASLVCNRCGSRICLMNTTTRHGNVYDYFFCMGRHEKRTGCDLPYLSVKAVEEAVERHWRTIKLPPEAQQTIKAGLKSELDRQDRHSEPEMAAARARLSELELERRRVARAVITGAVPEDLAAEEQERILRERVDAARVLEVAETVYAGIEATLQLALDFLSDPGEMYEGGASDVRKFANRALFAQIRVDTDRKADGALVAAAPLNQPFATLVDPRFEASMRWSMTNPGRLSDDQGLRMITLVPSVGFEPTPSVV